MSKQFLLAAINRLDNTDSQRVLSKSGIQFKIGPEWVRFDDNGNMVTEDGRTVTGGPGAVTDVRVSDSGSSGSSVRATASGKDSGRQSDQMIGARPLDGNEGQNKPGQEGKVYDQSIRSGRNMGSMAQAGSGVVQRYHKDPKQPGVLLPAEPDEVVSTNEADRTAQVAHNGLANVGGLEPVGLSDRSASDSRLGTPVKLGPDGKADKPVQGEQNQASVPVAPQGSPGTGPVDSPKGVSSVVSK